MGLDWVKCPFSDNIGKEQGGMRAVEEEKENAG